MLLHILAILPHIAQAFIPSSHCSPQSECVSFTSVKSHPYKVTTLHAVPKMNGDDIDFDAERKRLDKLLNPDTSSMSTGKKVKSPFSRPQQPISIETIPPPPPLTTTALERRKNEIRLLKSLEGNDNALSDLWALWFAERGAGAAADLLSAEELAGRGPNKWPEAEKRLRQIIEEHGVYWAEPVNRLATLLYQQGRLEESKALCEVVLSIKPWHFGALSGIVMVCASLGDTVNARIWADRRLPPLQPKGDNERREVWVKRATTEARKSVTDILRIKRDYEPSVDDTLGGVHPDSSDDSWQ